MNIPKLTFLVLSRTFKDIFAPSKTKGKSFLVLQNFELHFAEENF